MGIIFILRCYIIYKKMSGQVIVTNNTISSCTPVNLELTCGHTGGVVQYHLSFSDDPTVLKRNGINTIKNATLCIDKPAYIGCNKVEFGDVKYFKSEIGIDAGGLISDIGLDGVLGTHDGATASFGVTGTVYDSKYQYCINWDFGDGLNVSEFEGCKMALEFKGGKMDKRLTGDNGFPLCGGLSDQCSSLCGKLTLCGNLNTITIDVICLMSWQPIAGVGQSGPDGLVGRVYSIVRKGDCTYIGGFFRNIGGVTGLAWAAKFCGTTGPWEPIAGVGQSGPVRIVRTIVRDRGCTYIGGNFTSIGGVTGTARAAKFCCN